MKILCAHCQQHILNADEQALSYPLTRSMFTPARAFNDWVLPAALIDTWCPLCEQFPFYADLDQGGLKPRLLVEGEDGRPAIKEVSDALDKKYLPKTQQESQSGSVSTGGEGGQRSAQGKRKRGQGDKDRKLAGKAKKTGRPKKQAAAY